MAEETAISWTDHTHNYVWGCTHAMADAPEDRTDPPAFGIEQRSPECDHCYAEATDARFGGGGHWGDRAPRRVMSDAYWRKPLAWNAAAEREGRRHRVFCSSMADVFETHPVPEVQAVLDSQRAQLWRLIRSTPWLDWQLLTKRPENFARYLPWMNLAVNPPEPMCRDCADSNGMCMTEPWRPCDPREPWPNVWLGVTIGVSRSLWRARYLRETPAVVRFISGEPLLEHISGTDWDRVLGPGPAIDALAAGQRPIGRIEWLIIGDESGHGRRPCQPDWVRTAREAAARNGVLFHLKQLHITSPDVDGKRGKDGKIHLPVFDRRVHDARPQGIPLGQRDPVDPDHYP